MAGYQVQVLLRESDESSSHTDAIYKGKLFLRLIQKYIIHTKTQNKIIKFSQKLSLYFQV